MCIAWEMLKILTISSTDKDERQGSILQPSNSLQIFIQNNISHMQKQTSTKCSKYPKISKAQTQTYILPIMD